MGATTTWRRCRWSQMVVVTHDLRSALTVISGPTALLQRRQRRGELDDARSAGDLGEIMAAVPRLAGLIN